MTKRADGSYSRGWRRLTEIVLPPVINALMGHEWRGQENIRNVPADSGLILAINHVSYADVLAMCLFSYKSGRYPVFLAKSTLFEVKGLGRVVRGTGQLPVYRGQSNAALVLRDAERGLRNGACVIFYPEATVTRDPDLWPMVAKTGVARLALATGAPVIPVAQWGAQRILPYGSKRPHLFPRTTVQVLAGPPVDLSAFDGQQLSPKVLRDATDLIMKDITGLLARIRGETAPAKPYDFTDERFNAKAVARTAGASDEVAQGTAESQMAPSDAADSDTGATPA
jgi:1-acyl-sn-glycerol-3-phosphate acyltransferase